MKCGTCRHWEKEESQYYLGLGKCGATVEFFNATNWDAETGEHRLEKEYENRKAFTQDGSDYRSVLLTKPDFGCVQHEKKSDE